jgi:hypothetical protein
MVMAGSSDRIDEHWENIGQLRADCRNRRVVLGIDRRFARSWLLRGGPRSPILGRISAFLLVALTLISIIGSVFVAFHSEYLLGVFLVVLAFLSWKMMMQLAVGHARNAVMDDEALLRRWFHDRNLSILVKKTGTIVWNEDAD